MNHKVFMNEAFQEAQKAYKRGETPVGALIIQNGDIIARAGNRELELNDPTAHAEILVLREAGQLLGQHTFPSCTVYTTLWPCPMCENALLRAKIPNVVCGASSFKYIYTNTFNKSNLSKLGPIMEEECKEINHLNKRLQRTAVAAVELSNKRRFAPLIGLRDATLFSTHSAKRNETEMIYQDSLVEGSGSFFRHIAQSIFSDSIAQTHS